MFSDPIMRIPVKPLLALMLAMVLPLRGFASAALCEAHGAARGLHASSAHAAAISDSAGSAPGRTADSGRHCASGGAPPQHGCGDCCCVAAVALTPIRFEIQRAPVTHVAQRPAWLRPTLTVDRLDRPPRLAPHA